MDSDEEQEEHQKYLRELQEERLQGEQEEELRWELQELWGKTIGPNWELSKRRPESTFHHTLLPGAHGRMRPSPEDFQLLQQCAQKYAIVFGGNTPSILCEMARHYIM
jgi:hypothetical protein